MVGDGPISQATTAEAAIAQSTHHPMCADHSVARGCSSSQPGIWTLSSPTLHPWFCLCPPPSTAEANNLDFWQ